MIDTTALACSEAIVRTAYQAALRRDPLLSFADWAPDNVRNADGTRFEFLPYQVGPAHDLFDPRLEYVALRWFTGAGKTYLTSVAYAYGISQLKLRFGKLYPAEYQAKEWLEEDLMPVLDSTPAVGKLVKDNTLVKKFLNGGYIKGIGPSNSGIATMRIDVSDCDEIDKIVQKVDSGGNIMHNMEARTRNRPIQLHWRASFPSVVGASNIDIAIEASDGLRWWFDCPRCGAAVNWHPEDIEWEPGDTGTARVVCPDCGGEHTDAERRQATSETGHWRTREGVRVDPGDLPIGTRKRGYHLSCMAYQGPDDDAHSGYIAEVAAASEAADDAEDPHEGRRSFVNLRWAESYEIEYDEKAEPGGLMDLREHYDPLEMLPEGVIRIYCGIDFNKNFQAWQAIAFGVDTIWPLAYVEVQGRTDQPSTWDKLNRLMRSTWKHPLGPEIGIWHTFADSRYKTGDVRRWVHSKAGKMTAATGDPTVGAIAITARPRDKISRCLMVSLGADELKNLVYEWVNPDAPTRTRVIFHDAKTADGDEIFDRAYFDGLLAEEREMVKARTGTRKGMTVPHFTHPEGAPRNEPLDTFALAVAARKADKITDEHALAELKKLAEMSQNTKKRQSTRKKITRKRFNRR